MKINLEQIITELNGDEITVNEKPLLLKEVCITALTQVLPDDKAGGQVKFERMELALRIHAAIKEIEITPEEITILRELIGKGFVTIVSGRAWAMLNPGKTK